MRSCSRKSDCADSGRSQKSGRAVCSRSSLARAVSVGRSKTPPKIFETDLAAAHSFTHLTDSHEILILLSGFPVYSLTLSDLSAPNNLACNPRKTPALLRILR